MEEIFQFLKQTLKNTSVTSLKHALSQNVQWVAVDYCAPGWEEERANTLKPWVLCQILGRWGSMRTRYTQALADKKMHHLWYSHVCLNLVVTSFWKKSLSKQQQRKHPLQSRHNLPKFKCMLQSIRVLKLFRKEAGRTQSRNYCFPLASASEAAELFQLTFCKEKKSFSP